MTTSSVRDHYNANKQTDRIPITHCYVLMILLYAASPEAQRRNSLEKQLEKLDNDMSSLSKISALADTLTIGHVVNIYC